MKYMDGLFSTPVPPFEGEDRQFDSMISIPVTSYRIRKTEMNKTK